MMSWEPRERLQPEIERRRSVAAGGDESGTTRQECVGVVSRARLEALNPAVLTFPWVEM